jgi:hypothetical protein
VGPTGSRPRRRRGRRVSPRSRRLRVRIRGSVGASCSRRAANFTPRPRPRSVGGSRRWGCGTLLLASAYLAILRLARQRHKRSCRSPGSGERERAGRTPRPPGLERGLERAAGLTFVALGHLQPPARRGAWPCRPWRWRRQLLSGPPGRSARPDLSAEPSPVGAGGDRVPMPSWSGPSALLACCARRFPGQVVTVYAHARCPLRIAPRFGSPSASCWPPACLSSSRVPPDPAVG